MELIRSVMLRAPPLTSVGRPTSALRTSRLRLPFRLPLPSSQQAFQRRTYASDHSPHKETKSSHVPWIAAASVGTATGLFFVLNQDLGHGESHEDHQNESHASGDENDEDEQESGSKDQSEDQEENEKDAEEDGEKEDKSEPEQASPDRSDKADPRKEAKANETSGKQEGLSNADTRHSTSVSKSDDKSKKGEGVAETAKLKGTVSTQRPGAENKEERAKNQQDKESS